MKTITFNLNDDGTIVLESPGYKGASCAKDTKVFEDALHMDVKSDKKKPEWWVGSTVTQRLNASR